jgi:hypothetical protein
VKAQSTKLIGAMAALTTALTAGCGEVARNGRAPAMAVIQVIEAASGAEPDEFGTLLNSDVLTLVTVTIDGDEVRVPTIYSDNGRVTMRLQLRDPGIPGVPSAPSTMNDVTFTRYRVTYRRADGRNTPGVDVPYPFDSGIAFTVPADGTATAGFVVVRHTAKEEAPLGSLVTSRTIISTIAEVTFFGHDQAGNEVIATGNIGVFFGNFGDPD